jgi:hypothetical protein
MFMTISKPISKSVLYRSEDKTLPDFSKQSGPGGEVFFDVRVFSHFYILVIDHNLIQ